MYVLLTTSGLITHRCTAMFDRMPSMFKKLRSLLNLQLSAAAALSIKCYAAATAAVVDEICDVPLLSPYSSSIVGGGCCAKTSNHEIAPLPQRAPTAATRNFFFPPTSSVTVQLPSSARLFTSPLSLKPVHTTTYLRRWCHPIIKSH